MKKSKRRGVLYTAAVSITSTMGSQCNALYYFLKYEKLRVSSTDKVISKRWIIFAKKEKYSNYEH
jgi:hypothetical protein